MVLPYRWESRSSPNTIALQKILEGFFVLNPASVGINDPPASIPFGKKRQALNRKCREEHPKQALTRENRIAKRNLVPASRAVALRQPY